MDAMTVTGSISDGSAYDDGLFLDVYVLTGAAAAANQTGATSASGYNDPNTEDGWILTTTTVGSLVFAMGADGWNSSLNWVATSGSTLLNQYGNYGASI